MALRCCLLQRDAVSEAFELGDEAFGLAFGVAAREVVGSEVGAAVPGGKDAGAGAPRLAGGRHLLEKAKARPLSGEVGSRADILSTTMRASVGPTSTRGSSAVSLHAALGRGRIGNVPTARRMSSISDTLSVARSLARCQPAGSFTRSRSLRSTYVRAVPSDRGSTDSGTTAGSVAGWSCVERSPADTEAAGSDSLLDPQPAPTSARTRTNETRTRTVSPQLPVPRPSRRTCWWAQSTAAAT